MGNEKADELARRGSALDRQEAMRVHTPLAAVKGDIYRALLREANNRWHNLTTCRISRSLWPEYSINRTTELLGRRRGETTKLTAVLTGHWLLGEHAARLGLPHNTRCRSCGENDKTETIENFLCECPALSRLRLRTIGKPFLSNLKELSTCKLGALLAFINFSKWLDHTPGEGEQPNTS